MTRRRPKRVHGSLQRSLAALTIGHAKARAEREKMLAPFAAGNMMQQRQVPVSGKVGSTPVSTVMTVDWEHPFVLGHAQTDSDLSRPQFHAGVELLSDSPVMIHAYVIDWVDTDEGWTEKAKIRVTAWVPNTAKKTAFSAMLHLTFSGYAAPLEDDPSET